jgi:hypothetical protein
MAELVSIGHGRFNDGLAAENPFNQDMILGVTSRAWMRGIRGI